MTDPVELRPIAASEFAAFMEATRPSYARARAVGDHVSLEEAEAAARGQHAQILPRGFDTPGHEFLRIHSGDGTAVGRLWFLADTAACEAYLYDISIDEAQRRKGYASAAIGLVEARARAAGCTRIGLNVFEPNAGAQALYRKLGYETATRFMNKPL